MYWELHLQLMISTSTLKLMSCLDLIFLCCDDIFIVTWLREAYDVRLEMQNLVFKFCTTIIVGNAKLYHSFQSSTSLCRQNLQSCDLANICSYLQS